MHGSTAGANVQSVAYGGIIKKLHRLPRMPPLFGTPGAGAFDRLRAAPVLMKQRRSLESHLNYLDTLLLVLGDPLWFPLEPLLELMLLLAVGDEARAGDPDPLILVPEMVFFIADIMLLDLPLVDSFRLLDSRLLDFLTVGTGLSDSLILALLLLGSRLLGLLLGVSEVDLLTLVFWLEVLSVDLARAVVVSRVVFLSGV